MDPKHALERTFDQYLERRAAHRQWQEARRGDGFLPISGEVWRDKKGEPRRGLTWNWRCNRPCLFFKSET